MLRSLLLALACVPAFAQEAITIVDRRELPVERVAQHSQRLAITLVWLQDSGWVPEAIQAAVGIAAGILSQCGIAVEKAELVRVAAPARYLEFSTPVSRQLARALPLGKPAVYFVSGTRQRPAFEAEAIGRGNSRSRPELADTVWVTRGTRDPGIAVAHELAHVLMDSGEHSDEAGNLMREETAPSNTRLSPSQCDRIRSVGQGNGLLH